VAAPEEFKGWYESLNEGRQPTAADCRRHVFGVRGALDSAAATRAGARRALSARFEAADGGNRPSTTSMPVASCGLINL